MPCTRIYCIYDWCYISNINTYVHTDNWLTTADYDGQMTDPSSRQRENSNKHLVWVPDGTRHQDTLTVAMWLWRVPMLSSALCHEDELRSGGISPLFLTSAAGGGEWWISRSSRLVTGTQWIEAGWAPEPVWTLWGEAFQPLWITLMLKLWKIPSNAFSSWKFNLLDKYAFLVSSV
jgi:hypothetical protein